MDEWPIRMDYSNNTPAKLLGNRRQPLNIPSFFLFGEEPKEASGNYLHVESIAERSRPLNWEIQLHSHANLAHILHVADGGGIMTAEEKHIRFSAPCILLVPTRLVHGFRFNANTVGAVLTISSTYLQEIESRERHFPRLFDTARAVPMSADSGMGSLMNHMARELVWVALGHDIAVEALLIMILVECLRAVQYLQTDSELYPRIPNNLVARFRELIEKNYRSTQMLEFYTSALGSTQPSLRNACMRVTGSPPIQLIQNRILLEAKRALLYSNMSVKEIAHYLGFQDIAYFSRFFAKRIGQSPRDFRRSPEGHIVSEKDLDSAD